MGFRFTIAKKIGLGFGIILCLFLASSIFTYITLNNSRKKNEQITQLYNPSVSTLKEFDNLLNRSRLLITKWYYVQTGIDNIDKIRLNTLLVVEYPAIKIKLKKYSLNWHEEEQKRLALILKLIDEMFISYKRNIMTKLNSFESYQDLSVKFEVLMPFEDIDTQFEEVNKNLKILINKQNSNAANNSNEMLASFNFLKTVVVWLGILITIGGGYIAYRTVRSIVNPIHKLRKILLMMSKGMLPNGRIINRSDELGQMTSALSDLVDSMARTADFAKQIGGGNFSSHYKLLSKNDILGAALLKMRENLRENERLLEAKVLERTEQVMQQKKEIEIKNTKLQVLFTHVTDSIRYAKRIQDAILPPKNIIDKILPNSFVLFKPKDIVSGDFYWIEKKNEKTMFAAIDCTGHGVPGAFMSIVGYNILKQLMNANHILQPALLLDSLNQGVSDTLHHGQTVSEEEAKDGMDAAFCIIDYNTLQLEYAGAYNPLYVIRNNAIIQIQADKFPIGLFLGGEKRKFQNHVFQLQKGDCVYIFSDGYYDQFGGPQGRKFMLNVFKKLLLQVHSLPIDRQKEELNKTIEDWRGKLDQVDDILVIGLKIE